MKNSDLNKKFPEKIVIKGIGYFEREIWVEGYNKAVDDFMEVINSESGQEKCDNCGCAKYKGQRCACGHKPSPSINKEQEKFHKFASLMKSYIGMEVGRSLGRSDSERFRKIIDDGYVYAKDLVS